MVLQKFAGKETEEQPRILRVPPPNGRTFGAPCAQKDSRSWEMNFSDRGTERRAGKLGSRSLPCGAFSVGSSPQCLCCAFGTTESVPLQSMDLLRATPRQLPVDTQKEGIQKEHAKKKAQKSRAQILEHFRNARRVFKGLARRLFLKGKGHSASSFRSTPLPKMLRPCLFACFLLD